MLRVSIICIVQLWLLAFGVSGAMAQTLVTHADASMSAQDLEADLQRVPPEVRAAMYNSPADLKTNLSNLFVRRVLAAEAVQAGIDKDPLVKAAIDLARDRVLSDARLALLDKAAAPNQQAIEAFAQSTYNANPKRFTTLEKVRVRHILIRASEIDARAQAEALLKDLKAGADFVELAKTRSQDSGSAPKGGDLGLILRGSVVLPFEVAAFSLAKPGDMSEVIETRYGYHIIRLDEKQMPRVQSFDEVKEALVKEARAALANKARQAESDRILAGSTFDTAAIESFATSKRQ